MCVCVMCDVCVKGGGVVEEEEEEDEKKNHNEKNKIKINVTVRQKFRA